MADEGSPPDNTFRLKALLREAGLRSHRLDASYRAVSFLGRTREWLLALRLTADWLNIATTVCEVPREPGVRGRLLEWSMEANPSIVLLKFGTIGNLLVLEADYRAEHIDVEVLKNLAALVHSVAEERYPQVFRIVTGSDVLENLEKSMPQSAPS